MSVCERLLTKCHFVCAVTVDGTAMCEGGGGNGRHDKKSMKFLRVKSLK